jgi:hypothetical protein
VSGYLVDTDVLSEPEKTKPHAGAIAWLREHEAELYTSAVVIGEIHHRHRIHHRHHDAAVSWLSWSHSSPQRGSGPDRLLCSALVQGVDAGVVGRRDVAVRAGVRVAAGAGAAVEDGRLQLVEVAHQLSMLTAHLDRKSKSSQAKVMRSAPSVAASPETRPHRRRHWR